MEEQALYHGFSSTVDRFLNYANYSLKDGKHIYHFPAQFGQKTGVITYCIDCNNICYHRYFQEQTQDALLEKVKQKDFLQGNPFPTLAETLELDFPVEVPPGDDPVTMSSFRIQIQDLRFNTTIVLFVLPY
jgi:hypothetical protein